MKTGHEYLLEWFPNFDYHKLAKGVDPSRLNYANPKNIVGFQQRAFIIYWCLKGAENGGIGVDMGCGQAISPFCLGVDKYYGEDHPDYGGKYYPHVALRADKPLPFGSNTFDFLVSHHSLEHMNDTLWTLREWIRIVKKGGILALVLPDNAFEGADNDPDHKVSYSAEQFQKEILDPLVEEGVIVIVEFDNLSNHFSFNVVLKKC